MDIKEIREKKNELRKSLADMITKFAEETGAQVKDISIRMVPSLSISGDRTYIFGGADIDIEI